MFIESLERPDWEKLVYQSPVSLHILCSLHTCCSPWAPADCLLAYLKWKMFSVNSNWTMNWGQWACGSWGTRMTKSGSGSIKWQADWFFFYFVLCKVCLSSDKLGLLVFALCLLLPVTQALSLSLFLAVLLFLWNSSCSNISGRWVMRLLLSFLSWQVGDGFCEAAMADCQLELGCWYIFHLKVVLLVGTSPVKCWYLVLIGTYPVSLYINYMYSNFFSPQMVVDGGKML